MIAVVTILLAFPLGYFLRTHLAANVAFAIAYLWAFVFQTLYLVLDALNPASTEPAFGVEEFPWSYGVVALSIFAVGFGLVWVGQWVRARRGVRVPVAV